MVKRENLQKACVLVPGTQRMFTVFIAHLIHNILKGGDVSLFRVGKYRQGSGRVVACSPCRRSRLLSGLSSQAALNAVTVAERAQPARRWAAAPGFVSRQPRSFRACWQSGWCSGGNADPSAWLQTRNLHTVLRRECRVRPSFMAQRP